MRVEFHDAEEFIAELWFGGGVERVLRTTKSFRQNPDFPVVQGVSVVATYLVKRGGIVQILMLQSYVGDYVGSAPQCSVLDQADKLLDQLAQAAAKLGIEVRAGMYVHGCHYEPR